MAILVCCIFVHVCDSSQRELCKLFSSLCSSLVVRTALVCKGYPNKQITNWNSNGYFLMTIPVFKILFLKRRWRGLQSLHFLYESIQLQVWNWWFRDTHPSFYKAVQTNKTSMAVSLPLSGFIILSLKRKLRLPSTRIFTIMKIGDSGTLINISTRLFKQTNKTSVAVSLPLSLSLWFCP